MTEQEGLQLLAAGLAVASVCWLLFEIWVLRAPVSQTVISDVPEGGGERFSRVRVTMDTHLSPRQHWVWFDERQYEDLSDGSVLPVHVRPFLRWTRLCPVGDRRRLRFAAFLIVLFVFNLVISVTGA